MTRAVQHPACNTMSSSGRSCSLHQNRDRYSCDGQDIPAQGNVYPCQFARSPEFLVGNIRSRTFSELWEDSDNPVLFRFREKEARCRACSHRDLCGGGCRVRAHSADGDFLAEDPFCFVE